MLTVKIGFDDTGGPWIGNLVVEVFDGVDGRMSAR